MQPPSVPPTPGPFAVDAIDADARGVLESAQAVIDRLRSKLRESADGELAQAQAVVRRMQGSLKAHRNETVAEAQALVNRLRGALELHIQGTLAGALTVAQDYGIDLPEGGIPGTAADPRVVANAIAGELAQPPAYVPGLPAYPIVNPAGPPGPGPSEPWLTPPGATLWRSAADGHCYCTGVYQGPASIDDRALGAYPDYDSCAAAALLCDLPPTTPAGPAVPTPPTGTTPGPVLPIPPAGPLPGQLPLPAPPVAPQPGGVPGQGPGGIQPTVPTPGSAFPGWVWGGFGWINVTGPGSGTGYPSYSPGSGQGGWCCPPGYELAVRGNAMVCVDRLHNAIPAQQCGGGQFISQPSGGVGQPPPLPSPPMTGVFTSLPTPGYPPPPPYGPQPTPPAAPPASTQPAGSDARQNWLEWLWRDRSQDYRDATAGFLGPWGQQLGGGADLGTLVESMVAALGPITSEPLPPTSLPG